MLECFEGFVVFFREFEVGLIDFSGLIDFFIGVLYVFVQADADAG